MDDVMENLPNVALEAICIAGFSVLYIKVHRLKCALSRKFFGCLQRRLERFSRLSELPALLHQKCRVVSRCVGSATRGLPEQRTTVLRWRKDSDVSVRGTKLPLPDVITVIGNMPLHYACAKIYLDAVERLARKHEKATTVSCLEAIQEWIDRQDKKCSMLPSNSVERCLQDVGIACNLTELGSERVSSEAIPAGDA